MGGDDIVFSDSRSGSPVDRMDERGRELESSILRFILYSQNMAYHFVHPLDTGPNAALESSSF